MTETTVRALLLDIEGTTTPIEFVHRILFPFARNHVEEFLQRENVNDDVSALRIEYLADLQSGCELPPWQEESSASLLESATRYVYWLMDRDRKSTALKSLQGKLWEAGYCRGELQGEVYPDVHPAFTRWRQQQKAVCIFSSGSVLAQKLLFAHTAEGDLTSCLNAYFDTSTGAKTDARSYRSICTSIGSPENEVLFLSDTVAELDAARTAGLQTAHCLRPGSVEPETPAHSIIRSFDVVFP